MAAVAAKPATPATPRRRRAEARPGEIVEVALDCFLENGFEATKIEEVARRAGVAKGTVYVYFETKERLFRAVVEHVTAAKVGTLVASAAISEGPLEEWLPVLMVEMVEQISNSRAPAFGRLILQEAGRFPDLMQIWLEAVTAPLLGAFQQVIRAGQERGEIRSGDPHLLMISVFGPLIIGMVSRELLRPLDVELLDLRQLAEQHAAIVVQGLRRPGGSSTD